MPWINEALCTGCETCIQICPVNAVDLIDAKASINEDLCIRCGKCHDVCPEDAVRHDSERIPAEVAANLDRTRGFLEYCATPEEQQALMERMKRFFIKQRKVADLTLSALQSLEGDSAGSLLRKAAALRGQMNNQGK